MAVSPFDDPMLSGLLGDEEIADRLSLPAAFEAMLQFEAALSRALAGEDIIPLEAGEIGSGPFAPDVDLIRKATARDGVIGPEYVRQLRAWAGEPMAQHIHFGATSQDLVDTSFILQLRSILLIYEDRLQRLASMLADLDHRFGGNTIMGRTRMQDAMPIPVRDRIASWRGPLVRDLDRLTSLRSRLLVLQLGGAAGTLDSYGDKAEAVARRVAATLDLSLPDHSWHSQRDSVGELGAWLSLITGSLGKMGQDISLMAQNAVAEVGIEGGGTSSAMPHKQNPVKAEVLVTLARYNAALLGGLHQSLVHEQERSGAAWTLEWLVLPQMLMATGAALRTAGELCGSITDMGAAHG